MGRKWRVPPPAGHILSLGKTGLFVQRSELCVRMSHIVECGCLRRGNEKQEFKTNRVGTRNNFFGLGTGIKNKFKKKICT